MLPPTTCAFDESKHIGVGFVALTGTSKGRCVPPLFCPPLPPVLSSVLVPVGRCNARVFACWNDARRIRAQIAGLVRAKLGARRASEQRAPGTGDTPDCNPPAIFFAHPRSKGAARSAAPARPRGWAGYLAKSKEKTRE